MSKKLMGTLMVLGLVMALALPAFASIDTTPSNSGTEVTSADDVNEAAEEANEAPENEAAEVENESESGPSAQ